MDNIVSRKFYNGNDFAIVILYKENIANDFIIGQHCK